MLTVWGRANSLNVQKVMWTLGELGLAHERIPTGGHFGGNQDPAYLEHNPNGLVPTLRDGDLYVWESNAIVRYLAAKHDAGGLWPEDPAQRARADRWMDWALSTAVPAMTGVFMVTVRAPRGTPRPADFAQRLAQCHKAFGILEAALEKSDYLAGNRLTMGDIPVGVAVGRYLRLSIDRPDYPRLAAYFARLRQRPAYATHVMLPLGTCEEEWQANEREFG
jgi:glutathione S-transferase